MSQINLIVAASKNGVIGVDNKLPWHLPNDMKFFKMMTSVAVGPTNIIMGRKTFESFGAKPLPRRNNIVMTRDRTYQVPDDVALVYSKEEALNLIQTQGYAPSTFIIGGEEIYKMFLPEARSILLTLVDTTIDNGDAYFPLEELEKNWRMKESSTIENEADERHAHAFKHLLYERK